MDSTSTSTAPDRQRVANLLTPSVLSMTTALPVRGRFCGVTPMKTCTTCGVSKPISGFHKSSRSKDKVRSECKECALEDGRRYRNSCIEKTRAADRLYRANNKEKTAAYDREYTRRFPKARLAWSATFYAIKTGKLIKEPCAECGTTENVHAHHDDYDKPLEVRWLCSTHHLRLHAEIKRQEQK